MQPPQPTQQIGPAPLPTRIDQQVVQTPQGSLVLLQFTTPGGVAFYFLDPDTALVVADQLKTHGKQARSGIIVPPRGSGLS